MEVLVLITWVPLWLFLMEVCGTEMLRFIWREMIGAGMDTDGTLATAMSFSTWLPRDQRKPLSRANGELFPQSLSPMLSNTHRLPVKPQFGPSGISKHILNFCLR
jgi:hypothetical protein